MFDTNRSRDIPVVTYTDEKTNKKSVVIINHGYGAKNTEYSFIANILAEHGYFVVSIQHDLETDKPLPIKGNLFETRKPLWERGVENISFVIEKLKKTKPELEFNKIILIGHSNGGDISMMFATVYPKMVSKIISLDSRRHPFPRNLNIEILRFGASDDEPDAGVVPEDTQVTYIKDAKHIDLCDRGSSYIKSELQKSIIQFLNK
ncbi:MAG: alpha/beta hydrolase [Candidatus Paracaedibacteraceae bacterium]|nr:alpha/beta hydrolase [Candidatus Paracaedibacteraceae bacterium]